MGSERLRIVLRSSNAYGQARHRQLGHNRRQVRSQGLLYSLPYKKRSSEAKQLRLVVHRLQDTCHCACSLQPHALFTSICAS